MDRTREHLTIFEVGEAVVLMPEEAPNKCKRYKVGMECKGVLSNVVYRALVGKRVGVGLTHSSFNALVPSL